MRPLDEAKIVPPPSLRPARSLGVGVLALSAILALSGCATKAKTVRLGAPADAAALQAAQARADAAETALKDLRESLATAQNALGAATDTEQRTEARKAVADAQEDLARVQQNLEAQPDGAAKTAADAALREVRTALAAVSEALGAANAALVSGGEGLISFASMHTSLDRAQAALDAAQMKLGEALDASPDDSLGALLTQAQATLTTAQVSLVPLLRQELKTAEAGLATAEEDLARRTTERDDARDERDDARDDLATRTTERDTARDERDAARDDAAAQRQRADTYDPRISLTDALLPREGRFVPRGEARRILRTPRTDSGEAGWEKLEIATDAVAFAEGKKVGVEGGGLAATDELPLRAVTLRAAGRHPIRIQGDDGTETGYSNTDGVVTSSLQLSSEGVTVKFGGEGVIYYDNQQRFDIGADKDSWAGTGPDGKLGDRNAATGTNMNAAHAADLGLASASGALTAAQATTLVGYALDNPSRFGADRKQGDAAAAAGAAMTVAHAADLGLSEPSGNLDAAQADLLVGYATDNPASGGCWQQDLSLCGDWNHDDLTIAFGTPSQSPHGDPSYYWKVQAPLSEAQREQRLPNTMDPMADGDGRPQELGTYELWLSSYGGLDEGADADDAGDDTHRYLEYAAYGLFMVFDNVKATPSFSRPQAFAAGYDAFTDADGMRTTDVATSIPATFKGRTMARELLNHDDNNFITLSGATPLRGDVTLNACIGAGACTGDGIPTGANKISGMISNLELLRHDGVWIPYRRAAGGIPMAEGDIAADGSFGGQLEYPRTADGTLNTWDFDAPVGGFSKYAGNLYGPRTGLEAAGWWHMVRDNRQRADFLSLIGSFGAKCTEGCN